MGARGAGFRQAGFRQAGAPFISQITSSDASIVVTNPNGPVTDLKVASAGGISSVANFAALAALASAGFVEGKQAYVQSARATFTLKASTVATRTNMRIAASGLAGFQWVRQLIRDVYWEVQAAWVIDPTNSTGLASDDNAGGAGAPLLTYNELACRLFLADVSQATTVTCGPGNQQAGDTPIFAFMPHGAQPQLTFNGVPTVVYSSSVTSYVAASTLAAAADDNEFGDTGVPGGSFTAAGALAVGTMIKRTSGTIIYADVLKDLGGTTARVGQPYNPLSPGTFPNFAAADTYQLLSFPILSAVTFASPLAGNLQIQLNFLSWVVPPAGAAGPSFWFQNCSIQKRILNAGQALLFQNCTFEISGGASFEAGGFTQFGIDGCNFKGTGATRYSFSGIVNSEAFINCHQGSVLLLEGGDWNGQQLNFYDTTTAALSIGVNGRGHLLGAINGKGNTSKLVKCNQGGQLLTASAVSTGNLYLAASTTDANPIQWSATVSTTQTPGTPPIDIFGNGVYQTG